MKWFTRLLGGPRKAYKFIHNEAELSHVVYARNRKQADRRMKAFLSEQMFGAFALWDDPADVEREFQKCRLDDN